MPKFKPGDRVRFISNTSLNAWFFEPQLHGLIIVSHLNGWYRIESPIREGYAQKSELTLDHNIHTKVPTCLNLNETTT